jgi:glycosyltransferase involved in cell wall biosynthesis
MLRVLHVAKFYPPVPGGMERVVQSLCASTRGRLDSRVLAFGTGRRSVEEIVDGIPITRVGTWGAAGSVPVSPAFAARLRNAEADVMILHEPNPWALLSCLVARPRMPLAIWFHSEVVRPWLQYRLFYAPLARGTYGRARRFIVSSPRLAQHAAALRPYRALVSVVPFGIDAARWEASASVRRRAEQIRSDARSPLILFAGRLVPYKGVDVLIRATKSLAGTVIIVGEGPMRADWEALARRVAAARVHFAGEVSDEELQAYLHACDVFVLPSVSPAEAFGFVQLEAMACGKPVVSTSLPSGVPWVNRHEETGLVVDPGDAGALRTAIRRLCDDPALRARLGASGSLRVRTDFGLAQMADRLVSVCREVAETT